MANSKNLSILFLLLILCSCITTFPGKENTLRIRMGTVQILKKGIHPSYYLPWRMQSNYASRGSGAIITGNLILTNAHVVSDATLLQVQKENDPRKYEAELVHIAHDCDLALLQVKDESFFIGTKQLQFKNSIPEMKSVVASYGFPMGGSRISITEGVVSRIELNIYEHSNWMSLLTVQTDAAINPGNSGGPVIQDGKIVGIAFQDFSNAENIGYMIPIPVINRFLEDVADGTYDGVPSLGIYWSNLENPDFRSYLGLPEELSGIHIKDIISGSTVDTYLAPDDVILKINGINVANDSSIAFNNSRISYSHLISTRQVGEIISMEIFRKREIETIKMPLKKIKARITWYDEYESLPRYFVFGGIIFQLLNREYLKSWNEWWNNADSLMLYYFYFHAVDNLYPEREEFVIINQILPDPINTYISNTAYKIVDKINGITINKLEDVIEAVRHPADGYHVILVNGRNKPFILKEEGMEEANRRIAENYGIPSERRLNKKSGYGVK